MNPPHLLLLHGALGARFQFDALVPLLAPHFTLHLLDFEGHGGQPARDREFRSEWFAESVVAWLDEQGIEQAHLFGYSLGGYVACLVAREWPQRVARVATLGTRFLWDEATLRRELRYLEVETMRQKVPRFVEELAARHTALGWETVVAQTQGLLRANSERGGLSPEVVSAIEQPVRVIVGDRDTTAGVAESFAIYQALPQGQFEVLPATPHPLPRAPLPRLAASLVEFFAGLIHEGKMSCKGRLPVAPSP